MELKLVLAISVFALGFAIYLAHYIISRDSGSQAMRIIADAIKEGAEAFLKRQYSTIACLSLLAAFFIFILYSAFRKPMPNEPAPLIFALFTSLSFIMGAVCSAIAGYVGMYVSIRANLRTANAAMHSLNDALKISLRGGAVSGVTVVAMSLLGVGGLFYLFMLVGGFTEEYVKKIPFMIVGFGFGASFVALFAQLGGGIYTKAADVGADLVGKIDAGIPEDDPRNPAVIADLVGDNVGDCAGRGSDLFESTAAESIGAMILGVALYPYFGIKGIMFPLVVRAFGLLASIAGIMTVRTKEDGDAMMALNRGYFVTVIFAAAGFFAGSRWLLYSELAQQAWLYFFFAGLIGIITSIAFVYITQYYTEYKYKPVKSIAEASATGPATNIIAGFSVGLESTALPVLVISSAIIASYHLGESSGIKDAGLFGTAAATMGMLSTAAYILAMDTFGPITDNAGGIVEMSGQQMHVRKITDRLDAVGNTTKALTKGYAIGSAALASFLLFSAYIHDVNYLLKIKNLPEMAAVDIARPEVFIGGLLGAALIFLFSSEAIKAVGRTASLVIMDVRNQFGENKGILEGTVKPDYRRTVDIVTKGALKNMVTPGLLAVGAPVFVGLVFRSLGTGAESVAAFLMIGTISGILMATVFNNSGGAWDNAKKYIEAGACGGKKSDAHIAAIVGDTVGDPFKDTAGPSLHVLIKILSTLTLVLAPLFI
jgi:K(+)-stimulated pyrophosphate-energized sodium pump